jgi:hypothetical protein
MARIVVPGDRTEVPVHLSECAGPDAAGTSPLCERVAVAQDQARSPLT